MTTAEINLRDVLADLYPTSVDQRRIAQTAGIPSAFVPSADTSINAWFQIVSEARKRGLLDKLVEVASDEYPSNEWLTEARAGTLTVVKGPDIGSEVDWKGTDDPAELEKIIGEENTLLPVSFLEMGIQRARSVARIIRADGELASGFLTSNDLLITNHHVFPDEGKTRGAEVQFNYQATMDGLSQASTSYSLDSGIGYACNSQDDWAAVKIRGNPSTEWGFIELEDISVRVGERVNIIQHPAGGLKQIALYHNVVVFVGDARIQYLTDTLPGSSGSPVFNSDWRVVALHHSGGWLSEPGSKTRNLRNEGIPIGVVLRGIVAAGLT